MTLTAGILDSPLDNFHDAGCGDAHVVTLGDLATRGCAHLFATPGTVEQADHAVSHCLRVEIRNDEAAVVFDTFWHTACFCETDNRFAHSRGLQTHKRVGILSGGEDEYVRGSEIIDSFGDLAGESHLRSKADRAGVMFELVYQAAADPGKIDVGALSADD